MFESLSSISSSACFLAALAFAPSKSRVRLHFGGTTSYEDELFAAGHLDAHDAREDARDQGGVLWLDTQLTRFT
jgi:hypothetical protein